MSYGIFGFRVRAFFFFSLPPCLHSIFFALFVAVDKINADYSVYFYFLICCGFSVTLLAAMPAYCLRDWFISNAVTHYASCTAAQKFIYGLHSRVAEWNWVRADEDVAVNERENYKFSNFISISCINPLSHSLATGATSVLESHLICTASDFTIYQFSTSSNVWCFVHLYRVIIWQVNGPAEEYCDGNTMRFRWKQSHCSFTGMQSIDLAHTATHLPWNFIWSLTDVDIDVMLPLTR